MINDWLCGSSLYGFVLDNLEKEVRDRFDIEQIVNHSEQRPDYSREQIGDRLVLAGRSDDTFPLWSLATINASRIGALVSKFQRGEVSSDRFFHDIKRMYVTAFMTGYMASELRDKLRNWSYTWESEG